MALCFFFPRSNGRKTTITAFIFLPKRTHGRSVPNSPPNQMANFNVNITKLQHVHVKFLQTFVINMACSGFKKGRKGTKDGVQIWCQALKYVVADVDMSDYQREHASEIERLNEEDLELLATPEVVKMRETILHMLQNKRAFEDSDSSEEDIEGVEESTVEHNVSDEALNVTKIVTNVDYDDSSRKESKNWDEFSFSDVEDDDYDLSRSTPSQIKKVLSTADAKEWIEVNENSESQIRDKELECEELDDWVTINYSDIDN
ncbi:uncharacterized protein LOC111408562 [Olea europaea var. sylvestris]|uniref:uncharacterized protein LOC111408562 n=1 Tax=Olea europaea var. sylvestris TaxID=158386 RepID=UPI000C1D43D7|nr:uncharacterized protein LOC111408562 [Olea europaea var. sylvestris]